MDPTDDNEDDAAGMLLEACFGLRELLPKRLETLTQELFDVSLQGRNPARCPPFATRISTVLCRPRLALLPNLGCFEPAETGCRSLFVIELQVSVWS